ncbi:MAG: Cna B-type domain-containing protein [Clostridia bacterium]|nr:Cna B-type domain-containing protein [Clostridia bacterium]
MKTNKKFLTFFLCMIMIFSLLPTSLFAAGSLDTSRSVSLTIAYLNAETPIQKANFRLYHFATLHTNGDCVLTENFASSGIEMIEGKNDAAWMEVTTALHGYVQLNDIEATASGKTDDNGKVLFTGIPQGLYLVVGDTIKQGSRRYTAEPFVVSLPSMSAQSGAWTYDLEVNPKFTSKKIENNVNTITRRVVKVWNDEGFEFKRPQSISVVLLKDGEEYDSVALNAANNWRYEWNHLNENYTWTIAEKDVPANYTMKASKVGITYTITNTYKKDTEGDTVERQVTKVWNDKGNEDKRPSSVEVVLLKDGAAYETVTLNAANNWKYRWTGLSNSYQWSVDEKNVPAGYKKTVTNEGIAYVITNTYEKDDDKGISRQVKKIWNDSADQSKRPASVTVVLYKDGEAFETVTLNEENGWQYQWTGLSKEHQWTVDEKDVSAGYKKSVMQEGVAFIITNTRVPGTPEVYTERQVVKVWDDAGFEQKRPAAVEAVLYKNGEVYETVELKEENHWQHTWTGLDDAYTWTVKEQNVPQGYRASAANDGTVYVLTNTYIKEETVDRQVIKVWDDAGNEDKRPHAVTVSLLCDGEESEVATLNEANGWQYAWTGLSKEKTWTLVETEVPEGYASTVTDDGITFLLTNRYIVKETITVQKIWNDAAHESERPNRVEVELLRDGVVIDTVILDEACGWTHQWIELDGGYAYAVREKELDKYKVTVQQDGNTFVITNTYSEIPQTGQLWWPVPVLLAAGLLMILLGLLRRRGMGYEK